MKLLIVSLMLGLLVSGVFGVNDVEVEKQLSQKFEAREYSAVIRELERLRSENPQRFAQGDFDYLLARSAEEMQDLPLAMANYQSVAVREGVLRPLALRHLAHIARSTGNLLLESLYLHEISFLVPNGAAEARLAFNSFERSNFAETVRLIKSPAAGSAEESREMRFLLAEALVANREVAEARPLLQNFVDGPAGATQPDDLALGAAESLDVLDGGEPGKKAPQVLESEHVRRAAIYQFNRDFVNARLHYGAIVASWPQSPNAADALLQTGRGFAQSGDFAEALKWFERLLEIYPQSPAAKEALLQAASAYGRVGRPKEATKRYHTFIRNYPNEERVERARFNIVDMLRDQGSDTEAISECEQIRAEFKGKRAEALALFAEARIRIAREEWLEAIKALDQLKTQPELGGSSVPGGTSQGELAFLRAISFEGLKDYASAIDAFLSIPDGRGEYYGQRSTQHLVELGAAEASRSFVDQAVGRMAAQLGSTDSDAKLRAARALLRLSSNAEVREQAASILRAAIKLTLKDSAGPGRGARTALSAPSESPAIRRLASFGLFDEALAALLTQRQSSPADSQFPLPVDLIERADRADLTIRSAEPQWSSVPTDYPVDLAPKGQMRQLYPVAFVNELRRTSTAHGVDPRLILAIIRQESRFQSGAKSNAAARGLMQFISSTADKVAAELGRDNFRQDDLYDPETAIDLGARYLRDLYSIFPEQTEAVVASYNGGDDNMKRWLARSRSSRPERYVPEIQYSQSKDYVEKVLASYWMYKRLYDDQLRPL